MISNYITSKSQTELSLICTTTRTYVFLARFRFSEWRSWNFKSPEMLHCVVGLRMFKVSNFGSTFVFRVKLYPENYDTTNIQNVEHS